MFVMWNYFVCVFIVFCFGMTCVYRILFGYPRTSNFVYLLAYERRLKGIVVIIRISGTSLKKGMSLSFVLFHFLLTLRFLPSKNFPFTQLLCNERVQAINCFSSLFLSPLFSSYMNIIFLHFTKSFHFPTIRTIITFNSHNCSCWCLPKVFKIIFVRKFVVMSAGVWLEKRADE